LIRRAVAAALLATVVGGLAGPAFAQDEASQFCVGLNKKGGGTDNLCIDIWDRLNPGK
jgi:hypothetical protein